MLSDVYHYFSDTLSSTGNAGALPVTPEKQQGPLSLLFYYCLQYCC